jgi:hypothetical protein
MVSTYLKKGLGVVAPHYTVCSLGQVSQTHTGTTGYLQDFFAFHVGGGRVITGIKHRKRLKRYSAARRLGNFCEDILLGDSHQCLT